MYVKLFASLYQGTLRGRSHEILVFTNLLAHADLHGFVDKHWSAIADETGLSRAEVEAAILNLESPDLESRSPEMQGCRLIRADEHRAWGWKIVNYGKYRSIKNEDDRREQNRLAQERYRIKHGKHGKHDSNQSKQSKPPSAQAEAEAEAEADKEEESKSLAPAKQAKAARKSCSIPADFYPNANGIEYAESRRVSLISEIESFRNWHTAKGSTMKDWQAAWRTWCDKAVTSGRISSGPPSRASPTQSRDEGRREVIDVLTGRGRQHGSERVITGEVIGIARALG